MGPILPQIPVFGKELGISSEIMGSVTGILPIAFLIAKPAFGMIVDIYRERRKHIFILLILIMTLSYALMNFIPGREVHSVDLDNLDRLRDTCNVTVSSLVIIL